VGGLFGWARAYKEILRSIKNLKIGKDLVAGSLTVDSSWAKDAKDAKKGKKKGCLLVPEFTASSVVVSFL
jgi:hypothetical protein